MDLWDQHVTSYREFALGACQFLNARKSFQVLFLVGSLCLRLYCGFYWQERYAIVLENQIELIILNITHNAYIILLWRCFNINTWFRFCCIIFDSYTWSQIPSKAQVDSLSKELRSRATIPGSVFFFHVILLVIITLKQCFACCIIMDWLIKMNWHNIDSAWQYVQDHRWDYN